MAKTKTKARANHSADKLVTQLKKQLSDNQSLWESKYKVLKGQLKAVAEESYIRGYRDAIMDQAKLDEAFDKHMEVAAGEFEKMHLKKLHGESKSTGKKAKAKKAQPKKAKVRRRVKTKRK